VMSTFATLLVVPSIFAIVIGKNTARSPSIHPADPDSRYYSPEALANHGTPEAHRPNGPDKGDGGNGVHE
jgi:hypothetical protein